MAGQRSQPIGWAEILLAAGLLLVVVAWAVGWISWEGATVTTMAEYWGWKGWRQRHPTVDRPEHNDVDDTLDELEQDFSERPPAEIQDRLEDKYGDE